VEVDMTEPQDPGPVPVQDAFGRRDRDARMSQAAAVLAIGAAARGLPDRVDHPEAIGLPADITPLGRAEPVPVAEAVAPLPVDVDEHLRNRRLRIPAATSADLVAGLITDPDPVTAAALVEANLHSDSPLVRTSAAVAAIDTTGPRDDVLAQLVQGATSTDALTRDIGRIGLARIAPAHPALSNLIGSPAALTGATAPTQTAVLTHGTWGAPSPWWQPRGDFYTYLDGLVPPLRMHDPSFGWSGQYSDGARQLAATQLVAWLTDQGLPRPDFFAHSHGGTVANLATRAGAHFERLVLLSWPVHEEWFPDFGNVERIIDIRVNFDLVIIADLGHQTFTPPPPNDTKVESHVNGWFDHSSTHDPAYWDAHKLAGVL
jgi:pimeloyl-ACP methyl ester carboxylesterase